MQVYICYIPHGIEHHAVPLKQKWHFSRHYSFKYDTGNFSGFCCATLPSHPSLCLLYRGMCWVVCLWFCSHSQKPLMVIHHEDDCQFSQGTAVALLNTSWRSLWPRAGLGFMGNTMGAFLNTCPAGFIRKVGSLVINHTAAFLAVRPLKGLLWPFLHHIKITCGEKAAIYFRFFF